MRLHNDIPIPGSTRHKLIQAGLNQFSKQYYVDVEVEEIAKEAGVTVGALYHHFKSKGSFYGLIRDDITMRIIDRVEAAVESHSNEKVLSVACTAVFDGVLRTGVGKLFTEPDPRNQHDPIEKFLGDIAKEIGEENPYELGIILLEAIKSAVRQVIHGTSEKEKVRAALQRLL